MIREDADNFQRQLVHLFRVFEADVAVGIQRYRKNDAEGYGVSLTSIDPQVHATNTGQVVAQKGKAKKKDVLSD
jgi:hypothetical protein